MYRYNENPRQPIHPRQPMPRQHRPQQRQPQTQYRNYPRQTNPQATFRRGQQYNSYNPYQPTALDKSLNSLGINTTTQGGQYRKGILAGLVVSVISGITGFVRNVSYGLQERKMETVEKPYPTEILDQQRNIQRQYRTRTNADVAEVEEVREEKKPGVISAYKNTAKAYLQTTNFKSTKERLKEMEKAETTEVKAKPTTSQDDEIIIPIRTKKATPPTEEQESKIVGFSSFTEIEKDFITDWIDRDAIELHPGEEIEFGVDYVITMPEPRDIVIDLAHGTYNYISVAMLREVLPTMISREKGDMAKTSFIGYSLSQQEFVPMKTKALIGQVFHTIYLTIIQGDLIYEEKFLGSEVIIKGQRGIPMEIKFTVIEQE